MIYLSARSTRRCVSRSRTDSMCMTFGHPPGDISSGSLRRRVGAAGAAVAVAEVELAADSYCPGVGPAGQTCAVIEDAAMIGCGELEGAPLRDQFAKDFPPLHFPQTDVTVRVWRAPNANAHTSNLLQFRQNRRLWVTCVERILSTVSVQKPVDNARIGGSSA